MTVPSGVMSHVDYERLVECQQRDSHGNRCGRCDPCIIDKHVFASTQPLHTRLLRLERYTEQQTRKMLAPRTGEESRAR